MTRRTELQAEVINALISSKAIDFEAVGAVLGKYGARAAATGDAVGMVINWRHVDICIPPFLTSDRSPVEVEGQQARE